MVDTLACDICVIGAGSGGLSVAAGASQMGASTILIERAKMGSRLEVLVEPLSYADRLRKDGQG